MKGCNNILCRLRTMYLWSGNIQCKSQHIMQSVGHLKACIIVELTEQNECAYLEITACRQPCQTMWELAIVPWRSWCFLKCKRISTVLITCGKHRLHRSSSNQCWKPRRHLQHCVLIHNKVNCKNLRRYFSFPFCGNRINHVLQYVWCVPTWSSSCGAFALSESYSWSFKFQNKK